MNSLVQYTTDKGVAVLTLSDPPGNAYTYEMLKELDAGILEARFDNDVHVLVITGHGDKHFCAGANINVLRETDATFRYYFGLFAAETLARLEQTPKLCIAALNGHCTGGGLELALAADLRVARNGSYRIGFPEVTLGVMPGSGGAARLARMVGKGRAMEMLVEGTELDVADAAQAGLVSRVIDAESHDAFLREVMDYAHGFCPPKAAPLAIGRIKRAVQSGTEMPVDQSAALDRELLGEVYGTTDAKEGLANFGTRKKPTFRAR